MPNPSNDDNRDKNAKNPHKNPHAGHGADDDSLNVGGLPDLGAIIGEGTYAISQLNADGEPEKVISAGHASLHEEGISGTQQLDETMLTLLGVKTPDDAHRALLGDSGTCDPSSTTVGYNKKYAAGWESIWGSSSN